MLNRVKKIGMVFFIVITFILLAAHLSAGCAAPGAFQAKITGLEARFEKLEKVADNLVLWQKTVQAENITYGGAGTVAIGLIIITVVFLGAFGLLIHIVLKKTNLLKLVTCTVQKTEPHIRQAIKDQISAEVSNGGSFKLKHKHQLRAFTEKVGTFAEKD